MNLATQANNCRKPNKQTAQMYVAALYETAPPEHKAMLAELYTFFMPALPSVPKTDLQWAALAQSKDQTRAYLCHPYSDGEYLVATDGHAMHVVPTTLAAGYYHGVTGEPLELKNAVFPDWRRVMPPADIETRLLADIETRLLTDMSGLPVVQKGKKFGYHFPDCVAGYEHDKVLVDAALAGMKGPVQYGFNGAVLYLTDGVRRAVIHGFRS